MPDSKVMVDLHIHTTISDGTDSPEQLLQKVGASGIGVFSVTDHDGVKSVRIIQNLLHTGDPAFIPGVEFSCTDGNGKYHILGYGFNPDHHAIKSVVERSHAYRMEKVTARLDFLKTEYRFDFPQEEIENLCSLSNPGKPHIANLMVKYGYADTKEVAISDYINKIHFKNKHLAPEPVIAAILSGGGIPVLAHPFYGSGDELILGDAMERRLDRLIEYGLRGIEALYSGFSEKLRHDALLLAERYDLFVTAGSDYHGTNKMVVLGDTGLLEESTYPERLQRFLERFHISLR